MADSAYGAPQASGGGGVFADKPWLKWVLLGGVVIGVYVIYRRHAASTASAGTGTTGTTAGGAGIDPNTGLPYQSFATDPLTGLPINPATGQDYGQVGSASGDLNSWITSALKALGSRVSATDANNAVYRFTQGLSLTPDQQNIINEMIAAVGQPPGGPYQVTTGGTGTTSPATAPQWFNPATWKFATNWPQTVAVGNSYLASLGFIGLGQGLKGVIAGAPIYFRKRLSPGRYEWVRIDSLAQFLSLPKNTEIATLRGEQYVAPKAA